MAVIFQKKEALFLGEFELPPWFHKLLFLLVLKYTACV